MARVPHRVPRGVVVFPQLDFARQPILRAKLSRLNPLAKILSDLPVQRCRHQRSRHQERSQLSMPYG